MDLTAHLWFIWWGVYVYMGHPENAIYQFDSFHLFTAIVWHCGKLDEKINTALIYEATASSMLA